jgi:EAL domain-containing protein (putative c-di-GMP-specific phosphodiesterase class I)
MAVNVSARQLADAAFPGVVDDALAGSGLDPALVALEFTESALIAANPVTERVLDDLTGLGVRIGLDGSNDGDTAIVTGTIALAHSLGLRVVAEGVETEEQLERLRLLRCDLAQGYHFSEPVTDAEFDRFLEPRWSTGAASPN